jgi:hypothetical protein
MANHHKPLRLLQAIALQAIVLQATAAITRYCSASFCNPLRLFQPIASYALQAIANHRGYCKLSHFKLLHFKILRVRPLQATVVIASFCKLSQATASRCDYGKLLQRNLLQPIAAITSDCIVSYCKLLQVLAGYCIANLCGYGKLLYTIASYRKPWQAIVHYCILLQATSIIESVRLLSQAIACYCKLLRCKPSQAFAAIANYCVLLPAFAGYCVLLQAVALQAI